MISGLRPKRSDSQPASSGIGTLNTIRAPYIRPGRLVVEADDARQVDQREQVDDPEPAAAAAEDRRQEHPAQVAVGEDVAERVEAAATGTGSSPVRAALADERQDPEGDHDRRRRRRRSTTPRQPISARSGVADDRDDAPCRHCRRRYGH